MLGVRRRVADLSTSRSFVGWRRIASRRLGYDSLQAQGSSRVSGVRWELSSIDDEEVGGLVACMSHRTFASVRLKLKLHCHLRQNKTKTWDGTVQTRIKQAHMLYQSTNVIVPTMSARHLASQIMSLPNPRHHLSSPLPAGFLSFSLRFLSLSALPAFISSSTLSRIRCIADSVGS